MPALEDKRYEAFALHYAQYRHANKARDHAGFSQTTPGHAIASRKAVAARIREIWGQALDEADITPQRVMQELGRIAFADIRRLYDGTTGDLLSPHDMDDDVAATVTSIDVEIRHERSGVGEDGTVVPVVTKKVRQANKMEALGLLAKHFKIVGDEGDGVNALASALADRLKQGRRRAFNEDVEDARIIPPRQVIDSSADVLPALQPTAAQPQETSSEQLW